jgi:four helix bundle protein
MTACYRDLIAWQKAMTLVKDIYLATQVFSREETYGLKAQLRRAAVSVPSNIAEGQARYSRGEFYRFLNNARGSLAEVETQVTLAKDLGYLEAREADPLLDQASELGRILNGLIAATKSAA